MGLARGSTSELARVSADAEREMGKQNSLCLAGPSGPLHPQELRGSGRTGGQVGSTERGGWERRGTPLSILTSPFSSPS